MLLSWYVANFGSYNATYGSLGGVIGFMIWLWLSTTVVLVGGEINAELEHQTARDTTEGHNKPIGRRAAPGWPTKSVRHEHEVNQLGPAAFSLRLSPTRRTPWPRVHTHEDRIPSLI